MNKTKARKEAQENALTWGELKAMVDSTARAGVSTVNKNLTKKQALGIFDKFLETADLSAVPRGMVYSASSDKIIMSAEAKIVMNILRECAP